MAKSAPTVLMILDGWGCRTPDSYNAISQAKTPQWDAWWQHEPHCLLDASGLSVGLPPGQMGNSEVGHMHMGAGRLVFQDLTRINNAIQDGSFANNLVFNDAIKKLKNNNKTLHIMGLLSDGGVHSHEDHLFALIDLCVSQKLNDIALHLFLDGRDTPPQSALMSLERLETHIKKHPSIKIASISGRYYAMDRDKRWSRIQPVYQLLTEGIADKSFNGAEEALKAYYEQNITDEFIPPTRIGLSRPIKAQDGVIFFNFRADRARQLTQALIDPNFTGFQRPTQIPLAFFISMTQYDKTLPTTIAFTPIPINNTLGEVVANHGLSQLRIAETEKYAHVTFFFNGGVEAVYPHEERALIPSPKVATYDLQPNMSAEELTNTLVKAIESERFDFIVCNYANADMVGHTGNLKATISAIECLDNCMKIVWQALEKHQGQMLITADHGNAESMFDDTTNQPHTAHTCQPVPCLFIGKGWHFTKERGTLIDIAPTLLTLLGLPLPKDMTGQVLLEKNHGI
jgi:2,3-bisphosphoglycerate-independent phosphoglycerate mutase